LKTDTTRTPDPIQLEGDFPGGDISEWEYIRGPAQSCQLGVNNVRRFT